MQRVSIGRAIVRQPRMFLMDEPLSNLDAKLRESLRVELKHLQKTQGSTTLFVTHDQIEALTMADRIAVLDHGKVLQIGSPYDIYDRPATTYVAQLVGAPRINLLEAERVDGSLRIGDSGMSFDSPANMLPGKLLVGVRPEDVRPGSGPYSGEIILSEPLGVETVLHIKTNGHTLLSVVAGVSPYKLHQQVPFDLAHNRLHLFSMEGARLN
jgi:ABC-type sugar transport system ATPase subunit